MQLKRQFVTVNEIKWHKFDLRSWKGIYSESTTENIPLKQIVKWFQGLPEGVLMRNGSVFCVDKGWDVEFIDLGCNSG